MKWWHWALILGGGYVAFKTITDSVGVTSPGVLTPSNPFDSCCQKGNVLIDDGINKMCSCSDNWGYNAFWKTSSGGGATGVKHKDYKPAQWQQTLNTMQSAVQSGNVPN